MSKVMCRLGLKAPSQSKLALKSPAQPKPFTGLAAHGSGSENSKPETTAWAHRQSSRISNLVPHQHLASKVPQSFSLCRFAHSTTMMTGEWMYKVCPFSCFLLFFLTQHLQRQCKWGDHPSTLHKWERVHGHFKEAVSERRWALPPIFLLLTSNCAGTMTRRLYPPCRISLVLAFWHNTMRGFNHPLLVPLASMQQGGVMWSCVVTRLKGVATAGEKVIEPQVFGIWGMPTIF